MKMYVREFMREYGAIIVLCEDTKNPETSTNFDFSGWKKDAERVCPEIVLNLGEEPITLVTSLYISSTTSHQVWKQPKMFARRITSKPSKNVFIEASKYRLKGRREYGKVYLGTGVRLS